MINFYKLSVKHFPITVSQLDLYFQPYHLEPKNTDGVTLNDPTHLPLWTTLSLLVGTLGSINPFLSQAEPVYTWFFLISSDNEIFPSFCIFWGNLSKYVSWKPLSHIVVDILKI